MDSKPVVRRSDLRSTKALLEDVAWFSGSAATAFGVVDLFRTGKVDIMLHMFVTTEGRVIFIVAGAIGLVAGRLLRGRRSG